MKDDEFKAQARAMLLWGDAPDGVFTFLAEKGVSDQEARAIIREGRRERRRAVQILAIRKVVFGLFVISIPAVYFWLSGEPRSTTVRIAAVFGVIGIFGLWKLVDGLMVFLLPHSIRGSVTELGE